jgi:hypothetical protein
MLLDRGYSLLLIPLHHGSIAHNVGEKNGGKLTMLWHANTKRKTIKLFIFLFTKDQ